MELTHKNDLCTFDALIKKYKLNDPALAIMVPIVRGADTDRHTLANQASGLWVIAAGMAYNIKEDQELLKAGMVIYDALYTWAKHLQNVKHTESPVEQLLVDLYHKFLKKGKSNKIPEFPMSSMSTRPMSPGNFPNILTTSLLGNTSGN